MPDDSRYDSRHHARQVPLRSAVGEALTFLRAWMNAPLRVAAIVPSSKKLAGIITQEISALTAPVIELGPGTGAFTQRLLERGVPEHRLALVELDPHFASLLARKYPRAKLLRMNASKLRKVKPFDGEFAGAAVSGLPILSMPAKEVFSILNGVFAQLEPGASLYQFTYSHRCPIPRAILDRLGLKATRIGHTIINFPPASVYKIERKFEWGVVGHG